MTRIAGLGLIAVAVMSAAPALAQLVDTPCTDQAAPSLEVGGYDPRLGDVAIEAVEVGLGGCDGEQISLVLLGDVGELHEPVTAVVAAGRARIELTSADIVVAVGPVTGAQISVPTDGLDGSSDPPGSDGTDPEETDVGGVAIDRPVSATPIDTADAPNASIGVADAEVAARTFERSDALPRTGVWMFVHLGLALLCVTVGAAALTGTRRRP